MFRSCPNIQLSGGFVPVSLLREKAKNNTMVNLIVIIKKIQTKRYGITTAPQFLKQIDVACETECHGKGAFLFSTGFNQKGI